MLISCWSAKGGSGTTVVSAGLALTGPASDAPALLVDLQGDQPLLLGMPTPPGPGLAEWLASETDAPPDSLARLELPVARGLALLPRGRGPLDPRRVGVLLQVLGASGRHVVFDCGMVGSNPVVDAVAAGGHPSYLVTRACYLGLRRAQAAPIRASGVIVVREPGRALSNDEIALALGASVVAEVAVDPSIARAVDSGLLASRLPRRFAEVLRAVA